MIKHSFQELIDLRKDFDSLLTDLDLKVKSNDRIHQAFTLIEFAEKDRKDDQKAKDFMKDDIRRKKFYFSLLDIAELREIIKYSSKLNKEILKEKIKKYTKGNILPSEETTNNNEAKNIGFELSLTSKFISDDYNAILCKDNPDILIKMKNCRYLIECKRVFSESGIEHAIEDGKNQLNRILKNKNDYGIIALSFSRTKTANDMMFFCKDENDARLQMDNLFLSFIQKNQRFWKQITNNKIIAVLLHFSSLIGFNSDLPLSTSNFIVLNNVFDEDPNFIKLAYKLRKLKPY